MDKVTFFSDTIHQSQPKQIYIQSFDCNCCLFEVFEAYFFLLFILQVTKLKMERIEWQSLKMNYIMIFYE